MKIADLKERIPIEILVAHLGGSVLGRSWTDWERTTCPFHDDRNPSASTNRVLNRFNCHGCGVKGDIIDLAMHHLETQSLPEALHWLEETFLLEESGEDVLSHELW